MSAGALDGKVVLLTGASGGIGSLTARALGASGADLIGHYRSDRAGAEAAVAERVIWRRPDRRARCGARRWRGRAGSTSSS
jgi:NAD(P)-dependent dehydrogenase (short-subunit alcohol dehydrogenase family)